MNYDMLKIEKQLCFPLYVCSKEVIKRYKPYLDEIGLTYTQYITLMVLWEHKSLSVKEIGDILYLDSGTLTPLLKKIEKMGLIKRDRDLLDERNVIITITDEGNELKKRAKSIPSNISKCINLTSDEAKVLYDILHKIMRDFKN